MEKLKKALIIWVAIYPAITAILLMFGDMLEELPVFLRTFVLTIILVPLMVYVLIPFWTNTFKYIKIRRPGWVKEKDNALSGRT